MLLVFTIFCFIVDKKIKHKVLAFSFEIIYKVHITRFKDPKADILTPNAYKKTLWFCEIITEAAYNYEVC